MRSRSVLVIFVMLFIAACTEQPQVTVEPSQEPSHTPVASTSHFSTADSNTYTVLPACRSRNSYQR